MRLSLADLECKTRRLRMCEFVEEMNLMSLSELLALLTSHTPAHGTNAELPQFEVDTMLYKHFSQQ